MVKPLVEVDHENIRKELKNVRTYLQSYIELIIDADEKEECTILTEKANAIIYKIDCDLNAAHVIDLKRHYADALDCLEELKTTSKSLA